MKWKLGLALAVLAWSAAIQAQAADGDRASGTAAAPSTATTVTVEPTESTAQDLFAARDAQNTYGSTTKGPYYYMSENELRARKLSRGVANVGLCVAEVPNQMFREAFQTSPVTGAVVGLFKGTWMGAKRLAIGTWEIATFYMPGNNHYQPYIEPEIVFEDYQH